MPGKDPYSATEAFLHPLESALSCVARGKILVTGPGRTVLDREHFWSLAGGDGWHLELGGDRHLQLGARMRYMLIRDERPDFGPYRVTTRGYIYSVRTTDGQQVVQYHWHPSGQSHEVHPHLHVGAAQLNDEAVITQRQHLPTGRVTFEEIIRMAIVEFGAEPLVEKWDDRLTAAETPHKLYRSWPSAQMPGPPTLGNSPTP